MRLLLVGPGRRALAAAAARRALATTSGDWAGCAEVAAFARSLETHVEIVEAVAAARGAAGYASPCPVVGASVGAHVRHSLEHARCVADAVASLRGGGAGGGGEPPLVPYDARARSAELETDPARAVAYARDCRDAVVLGGSGGGGLAALDAPVLAAFALSPDDADDTPLASTIARELAFAAHHATHHFAMIDLIARGHLDMDVGRGLGKAPATARHEGGGGGR